MAGTIIYAKENSNLDFRHDDSIRENKWVRCSSRCHQLELVIYERGGCSENGYENTTLAYQQLGCWHLLERL